MITFRTSIKKTIRKWINDRDPHHLRETTKSIVA
jgi:hypothetical protein